eukprot:4459828-Prymnesium_polylepis.1
MRLYCSFRVAPEALTEEQCLHRSIQVASNTLDRFARLARCRRPLILRAVVASGTHCGHTRVGACESPRFDVSRLLQNKAFDHPSRLTGATACATVGARCSSR